MRRCLLLCLDLLLGVISLEVVPDRGIDMAEQVFFDRGGVKVTLTRFMVDDETYAVQGITSVRHGVEKPSKVEPIGMMVIGAILMVSSPFVITLYSSYSLSSSASSALVQVGLAMLLIGGVLVGAGTWWLRRLREIHTVVLRLASGESRAVVSDDVEAIIQIVGALNGAIVARG